VALRRQRQMCIRDSNNIRESLKFKSARFVISIFHLKDKP
jgi:hypothetical protein